MTEEERLGEIAALRGSLNHFEDAHLGQLLKDVRAGMYPDDFFTDELGRPHEQMPEGWGFLPDLAEGSAGESYAGLLVRWKKLKGLAKRRNVSPSIVAAIQERFDALA